MRRRAVPFRRLETDGEMINPPPNAIVSGNNRSDDLIAVLCNPEEIGLNLPLPTNEFDWLVPWGIVREDGG
jgi:hypothetical protein